MDKNPFDLATRAREGGPARAHPAHDWTPEEKAEKLAGYLEISPEFWEHIRHGTHVRYVTRDGKFRPGGFVQKNPFDTEARGSADKKRFMKLQNGFNEKAHGYASWVSAYEDLAQVWVKPDAATLMMLQNIEVAVRGLNENIRKVADFSKKLDARIAALER